VRGGGRKRERERGNKTGRERKNRLEEEETMIMRGVRSRRTRGHNTIRKDKASCIWKEQDMSGTAAHYTALCRVVPTEGIDHCCLMRKRAMSSLHLSTHTDSW
jgi:hypothetical protein